MLAIPLAEWPEGIQQAGAHVTDAVSRQSPQVESKVKVDRTGPNLDLGGSLHRARTGGEASDKTLHNEQYDLTINATDGVATPSSDAEKRAGTNAVTVRIVRDGVSMTASQCETVSSASPDLSLVRDYGANPTQADNAARNVSLTSGPTSTRPASG